MLRKKERKLLMLDTKADVCVVGLGYIGLPTAVFFANAGLDVVGVDVNTERIKQIQAGRSPFHEHGLEALLLEARESDKLETSPRVLAARTFIVAVPTPLTEEKTADLSFVMSAVEEIAQVLQGGELIIIESTSPPGTTRKIFELVERLRPDLCTDNSTDGVEFAYCPERVLPGNMVAEFVHNNRIVGGTSEAAADRAGRLYEKVCEGDVHRTDAATAELAKLAENTFRDINIAFANELSILADSQKVDVWRLIELANLHPRVNILNPGPGVGGHCIAVDPWFLAEENPEHAKLTIAGRRANDFKTDWVIERIQSRLNSEPSEPVIFWGLTFKSDVDDLRESPALHIVHEILELNPGRKVKVIEPFLVSLPESLDFYDNVELISIPDKMESINVFLVGHSAFRDYLAKTKKGPNSSDLDFVGLLNDNHGK